MKTVGSRAREPDCPANSRLESRDYPPPGGACPQQSPNALDPNFPNRATEDFAQDGGRLPPNPARDASISSPCEEDPGPSRHEVGWGPARPKKLTPQRAPGVANLNDFKFSSHFPDNS